MGPSSNEPPQCWSRIAREGHLRRADCMSCGWHPIRGTAPRRRSPRCSMSSGTSPGACPRTTIHGTANPDEIPPRCCATVARKFESRRGCPEAIDKKRHLKGMGRWPHYSHGSPKSDGNKGPRVCVTSGCGLLFLWEGTLGRVVLSLLLSPARLFILFPHPKLGPKFASTKVIFKCAARGGLMIKKVAGGYKVVSSKGKNLG